MFKCGITPLAADGDEVSVEMQKLLAASEGERYARRTINFVWFDRLSFDNSPHTPYVELF